MRSHSTIAICLLCENLKKKGLKQNFLNCLPQLECEETALLERKITLSEIEDAINDLNSGKSPGPDGIGALFYKKFKAEVMGLLHGVFSESYERGSLLPSCKNAHTVLIPKGEDSDQSNKLHLLILIVRY